MIFFNMTAFAGIHLELYEKSFNLGSFQKALLTFDQKMESEFELKDILNKNINNILLIQSVSKKSDNRIEAIVIFLSIPNKEKTLFEYSGKEIPITWSNVIVSAVEVPDNFILGNFSIPERAQWLKYTIYTLVSLILLIGGAYLQSRRKKLKLIKEKKVLLKQQLLAGACYSDVVKIWQEKHHFIAEFPGLDKHFKDFEKVLFKYQFCIDQTDDQKKEVMRSYRHFCESIRGGFDGI